MSGEELFVLSPRIEVERGRVFPRGWRKLFPQGLKRPDEQGKKRGGDYINF